MRENDFRRIALGMEGAVEGAHMGHPDFRVNNRIFATLHHDRESGGLTLTPAQQEQFVHALPGALAELAPVYLHAIPIDPFSGSALLLKKESDGYSVYSVGTNRRDDGAMDMDRPFVGASPKQYPADVGMRVQYR
jgi:hypothetical protein